MKSLAESALAGLPGLAASDDVTAAYQQILEGIVRLSDACHDVRPNDWPANFMTVLINANLAFMLGQRQPMQWLNGFGAGLNAAVGAWMETGATADSSLN